MNVKGDLVRVTAFLLAGLMIGGLLYMTLGEKVLGAKTRHVALFTDASGLEAGDLVRVAGVRVGQVADVAIADGDQARVTFDIDDQQPVLGGTRAAVRYENLIGDRYLELQDGAGSTAPLGEDEEIPTSRTAPALDLDVLLNGFRPLFQGLNPDQVNALATDIVNTLQGKGGTVASLLEHTASLTSTLADRDQVIGRVVDNLNVVLGTLADRDEQLSTTLDQLQQLVSGLAADRQQIGDALTSINTSSRALTDLLVDARPPLQGTIHELNRTAGVLDENRDSLDAVLHQIPEAYDTLLRVGSYGSFFNFYICSVQVKVTGPDGEPISSPVIGSNQNTQRCRLK